MRYPLLHTGPLWLTSSVATIAIMVVNCSSDGEEQSGGPGGQAGMVARGGTSGISSVDAGGGARPDASDGAAQADTGPALEAGGGGRGGSGGAGNETMCGDLVVEPPEQCEDGNDFPGDGCENDCRYTCVPGAVGDSMCNDGLICNGTERCRGDFTCEQGTPRPDGTRCGDTATCQGGMCVE